MKPFFWKIVICLLPNLLAGWAVWRAADQYAAGEGGFKLGVDLVGGTILVYEIDTTKINLDTRDPTQQSDPKLLAAYLKRRIDPNDLYNIVVRMVGDTRVEIILPTGGKHRTEMAQKAWEDVIAKVKAEWGPKLKSQENIFDVGQGKVSDLAERIQRRIEQEKWPALLANKESWAKLTQIAENWQVPAEEVKKIKPGDYLALADRVQNYRKAVEEIKSTAQTEAWKQTIAKLQEYVRKKYAKEEGKLKLDPGNFSSESRNNLALHIRSKGGDPILQGEIVAARSLVKHVDLAGVPTEQEINDFLDKTYGPSIDTVQESINRYYKASERRDVTTEEIQKIKDLISHVGKLEFLILANDVDDKEGVEAATQEIKSLGKEKLDEFAKQGKAPPGPISPDGRPQVFSIKTAKGLTSDVNYSWVEMGWQFRKQHELSNKFAASGMGNWATVAAARDRNEVARIRDSRGRNSNGFLYVYSRECKDQNLTEEQRKDKKYDYFILVRDPEIVDGVPQAVTGSYLSSAYREQQTADMRPAVGFRFNATGARLFLQLTRKNTPSEESRGTPFYRHLAIVLDGQVMSAPTINSEIEDRGQITGDFTAEEVDRLVNILRSGALPATLKPQPVSENTMGATLGEDTIRDGVRAVGIAFAAVLLFMVVYYRFAGFVACVALLSNLLLTVGFMVAVQATFTLPGLAGLVLMLGMAVDANVLIYERLREERERGASLPLAIRNGYDRAFPTIIDTHLTSIFTAIVLYVVGNDQLKGFGVSLTVGLVISLFTSLYLTRLLFDLWQNRGWLKKLSMFKLLSRPNIDFMAIRYYWFTATILLTVFGVTVFLLRGEKGLNIDFVGGTAYGGKLDHPLDLGQLRLYFTDQEQKERLAVKSVKEVGSDGHTFTITYNEPLATGDTRTVYVNNPLGANRPEREADVRRRAEVLPDWSIEQVFLSNYQEREGNKSRFFTVRTVEKEVDLVQASIDRLLQEKKEGRWESLLEKIDMDYQVARRPREKRPFLWFEITSQEQPLVGEATLDFYTVTKDGKKEPAFASPSYVTTLLSKVGDRLKKEGKLDSAFQFSLTGEGQTRESHYKKMLLTLASSMPEDQLRQVLGETRAEFNRRPQPERLENFDSTLAAETRGRAVLAIVLSWGAILLYLWFRFGSWTFGLAAVLCLIHDLFFTLGIIAFASFLHGTWIGDLLGFQDFKLDLTAVAALLTLVGYSVSDTIVVFDRIREVRGKNPDLTPQIINDSVNQTLSRTLLTAFSVWLVVSVLYAAGGPGVHLFAFVMVVGVIVGTYSSIYIASPLLLIFGEGSRSAARDRARQAKPVPSPAT